MANAVDPPGPGRSSGKWGSRSLSPIGRSQGASIRLVAPLYHTHLDEDRRQHKAIASILHQVGADTG